MGLARTPPGSTHDLTAARGAALIDTPTTAKVMVFADKGHHGAGGTVRTPFRRVAIPAELLRFRGDVIRSRRFSVAWW
ncbi:hypothetical protein [Nonomuraea angiospora]|uniref:hypothetical protein n=1 Tax=Nonomuraea angiospora TaxID=46172 RepID=UPI003F53E82F